MALPPRAEVRPAPENRELADKIKRFCETPVITEQFESIVFLGETQIHRVCETCLEKNADATPVVASHAYLLKGTMADVVPLTTTIDDGRTAVSRATITMRTECLEHMRDTLLAVAMQEDSKEKGREWSSAQIFFRGVCGMCSRRMWADEVAFVLNVGNKVPERFCAECTEILMFGREGTMTKAARPET